MELWIRSQNREKLVSVHGINLYDRNIIKKDFTLYCDPEHYDISIIANDNYNLGTYKTKERALEVLDEIQKHIARIGQGYVETDEKGIPSGVKYYGNIYEMPSE